MLPTLKTLKGSDKLRDVMIQYDREADILSAKVLHGGEWSLGFNISGCLVFDLDSKGGLSNLDCLIGKKQWHKEELQWPTTTTRNKVSNLQFDVSPDYNQLGKRIDQTYSSDVVVYTNRDKSVVKIIIGEGEVKSDIFELAPNFLVSIQGNALRGIWLKI